MEKIAFIISKYFRQDLYNMSQVSTGSRSSVPWVYTKPEVKAHSYERARFVEHVPVEERGASEHRPINEHFESLFSDGIFSKSDSTFIQNRDCKEFVPGTYPSNLELRKYLSPEGIRGIHDFREVIKSLKMEVISGEDLESFIAFLESGVNRACFHPGLGDLKGALKTDLKELRDFQKQNVPE